MNVGKAIELFTLRMQSKNWSKSTMDNYASQVRCFLLLPALLHHYQTYNYEPVQQFF